MTKAFVPNFNAQNAHVIYPAADVSGQISTADLETLGSGNMKSMLNGAPTIDTRDGASDRVIGEYCDTIWTTPLETIHLD